jgi:PII-like signaling protein
MKIPEDGALLRIFIGEGDRWQGKPAYEAIVLAARESHLAGATVFHGSMGFGARSRLHTFKILRLSEDLPVVIEIVDSKETIEAFIAQVDKIVKDGLITVEPVRVIKYRADPPPPPPPST